MVAKYNHQRNGPQYSVSESAAAVETEAKPNITITTEGRQHMDARMDADEIHFHKLLSITLSSCVWHTYLMLGSFVSFSLASIFPSIPVYSDAVAEAIQTELMPLRTWLQAKLLLLHTSGQNQTLKELAIPNQ